MEQKYLFLIIGILGGIIIGIFTARNVVNSQNFGMMNMMGMRQVMRQEKGPIGMSMQEMAGALGDLRGDDFDAMFLKLMIEHHEGAIEMANLAIENSERAEIKDMAQDIISAQTSEIEMMKGWMESWY